MVNKRILISRTDSIGDVILTLPLAVALKETFPDSRILFLGRSYTQTIIESCPSVDEFFNLDALKSMEDWKNMMADVILHVFPEKHIAAMAKKAGIPLRIGTSHRIFHWWTCNTRLNLGRKNSDLHEAQLNLKLGIPLGLKDNYSLEEIRGMECLGKPVLTGNINAHLVPGKIHVILHPKSKGSAREWGLENFSHLIRLLPEERVQILITGTAQEGAMIKDWICKEPVTDLTGKLSLTEFMQLISGSDVLVAASTGPLHIAASLGIHAFGIYAPIRPMHIGRWGPLGIHARGFSVEQDCSDCRKSDQCHCIREVHPEQIAAEILKIGKG